MYERFQQILDERGLKASDVVKNTHVSSATLSQWKKGVYTPKKDKMLEIAEYLEVSLSWLMGISEAKEINTGEMKIPVLGQVRAGNDTLYASDDIIDTVEISASMAKRGDFFGLKIKGDSMNPALMDGDVVIVKKQSTAETGDIVIALVNGENGICKQLIKRQDGITLKSINADYGDFVYNCEQIKTLPVVIVGKVEEMRRNFK